MTELCEFPYHRLRNQLIYLLNSRGIIAQMRLGQVSGVAWFLTVKGSMGHDVQHTVAEGRVIEGRVERV
jgi:hypothetical protein